MSLDVSESNFLTVSDFFDVCGVDVLSLTSKYLEESYKFQFGVTCKYSRIVDDYELEEERVWSVSLPSEIFTENCLVEGARRLDEKLTNFKELSSTWKIVKIMKIFIIFIKFENLSHLSGK